MAFNDDEEPPASSLGSSKGLVTLKEPTYSRDDVALTADEVTVVLELVATSSTTVREGLDLVAVVDVSTDMRAEKLAGMKKAMQFVITKLTPVDRFSIVAFSDSATRHCPLRSITQLVQADLRAIVESLVVGGGANIQAGLDTALAVIAGRTSSRARTANIFLMSDGRQNYNTDARRSDSGKVAVYTFGFGKEADYRLLSDVARNSLGGTYSSVPDGQSFASPLAQVLGGLHTVVAQDVQLTLTPRTDEHGDARAMFLVPRTDNTQTTYGDNGVITIMLGTLFSGEARRVAVTIRLHKSTDRDEYDVPPAYAQLSYTAQGDVQYGTPYDILFANREPDLFDPADVSWMAQIKSKPPVRLQYDKQILATGSKPQLRLQYDKKILATGSKPPLRLQYDKQILATGSKPPLPLQYLKDITNNFSDERILGKGGFGVVYKGLLENGETVAVKKLLHAMPTSQKQFENEVNLLMKLEHPNIVRLVGYCYETQHLHTPHEGKSVFAWNTESLLCLECLPNGSLDKYISDASSGLDWHTRSKIIQGISNGLQYLHGHSNEPIIHLDLKPANVLLDVNMDPKITDFGLSKLLDQTKTIHTEVTSGTLGYMPPEYTRGIITPMSDIFSLGVIIMEVITGHRDYPYDIRKSSEEFIEHELQNWRNKLQTEPGYTSLETDCAQIERYIQIGLVCVNPERTKRPKMKKIVNMLEGLESMNWYITNELSSHNIQEEP